MGKGCTVEEAPAFRIVVRNDVWIRWLIVRICSCVLGLGQIRTGVEREEIRSRRVEEPSSVCAATTNRRSIWYRETKYKGGKVRPRAPCESAPSPAPCTCCPPPKQKTPTESHCAGTGAAAASLHRGVGMSARRVNVGGYPDTSKRWTSSHLRNFGGGSAGCRGSEPRRGERRARFFILFYPQREMRRRGIPAARTTHRERAPAVW